jgi:GH15 family glucan-1,4-alpha-glucosidase
VRIEDHALIGDTRTAALVTTDGSVDWLCPARFDAGACFAALLGGPEHGRWRLAPAGGVRDVRRRYRDGTLVLETEFRTADGAVRLVDHMPLRDGREPRVVRIVEGVAGHVPMRMDLTVRFDHGSIVPWVRRRGGALWFAGGPDSLWLHTPVGLRGEGLSTRADFAVCPGDRVPFVLTWRPAHEPEPEVTDPFAALRDTETWWRGWSARRRRGGEAQDAVLRSLITLKALTYAPTGGVVAAPTTSLPEDIGGVRNWDYRYCWLRDATFTLLALLGSGFTQEARAWRDWLLRAVAGDPRRMQIMYGPAGERRLPETVLPWLPGYEGSAPVRIGNAAVDQFQLDVYGEVMDALHQSRVAGVEGDDAAWALQRALMDFLETDWDDEDEGIWEVRGPRRDFTHSKVMAWVAFDRAVKGAERFGLPGPVDRWRRLREEVRREVLDRGYDPEVGAFVQSFGSRELDASLLMIPMVGFLPARDPRVVGTAEAVMRHLMPGGLVLRYGEGARGDVDGLPGGEGAFLPCSFWLADNLAMQGRTAEARELFGRLLGIANDVGLLSEEYDTGRRRMTGNFPQAFSHVGLINTARNLTGDGPAARRAETDDTRTEAGTWASS